MSKMEVEFESINPSMRMSILFVYTLTLEKQTSSKFEVTYIPSHYV
jgi:hypothetical protein